MKYPAYLSAVGLMLLSGAVQAQAEPDWPALLAKNPTFTEMKISPDGKLFAAGVYNNNKRSLIFFNATDLKPVGVANMTGSDQVGEYHWVNHERVVFKLTEMLPWEREPKFYGELYAINADGSKGNLIFGYRAGEQQTGSNIKRKESKRAWAEFIDPVAHDDRILISATPMSEGGDLLADILLLDVYNGKSRRFGRAPVSYSTIVPDVHGRPRVAVGTDKNYNLQVYLKSTENDDWLQLPERDFGHVFTPLAVTADNQGLYVVDNFGQDTTGVFEYRFADGSYKKIFSDAKVDIGDVAMTADGRAVYGVRLDDGRAEYVLLSKKHEEAAIFRELLGVFPGEKVSITSKSKDNKKWVVAVSSDAVPVRYFLYDHEQVQLSKIADSRPELAGLTMATTEPVSFKSFDGMDIHGYLTKSPKSSVNQPMVVLVHGGPHGVRDSWGFDPEVQLLAMSGYHVLQVNYRGSGGYGLQYQQKGYRQWGAHVQQDIIAGTQWALTQGHAKAGNLCIMGASFGGYSAVQTAVIAPDLFKCAIATAGVYDLSLLAKEGDITNLSWGTSYLKMAIGNDPAELQAYSPVHQVAKLKTNLLIAHGKKDERAPLIHATRLQKALDKAGKPYEWLPFDDETHGFYAPENREIYFRKVQQFLSKNLTH